MRAADVTRGRWSRLEWPASVVVVEDRAATVRVITSVGPGRPRADQVLRAFDALGGLAALDAVLTARPGPDLVIVDATTCGELSADVLLGLERHRSAGGPTVLVLTATAPGPEPAPTVDLWAVKSFEITDRPDAIRALHAATGRGGSRAAGAA